MHQHDVEIPRESTAILVSHLSHGGIQLWDRYDQFNLAYTQLTSGVYTLSNLFTAVGYFLLLPFFKYPGEAFHTFHSVVWHGSNMLIRTIGGFLLLRQFTSRPWVIVLSLVYLNTLLTSGIYCGLLTNNLYSYLPLVLFFIIRFFTSLKMDDFLAFLIVASIVVANSPLFALGYFYLVVHFFLFSYGLYLLYHHLVLSKKEPAPTPVKSSSKRFWLKVFLALGLCFLILLPNFYWAKALQQDFFMEGSGFGGTEGRMKQMFNPQAYFERESSYADPDVLIPKSVDFWENEMSQSWIFIGVSTLLLSVLGMVFGKNKLKHIFFWTILLIISANFAKDASPIFSFAHWITAYTNPFAFLVRGFQMPALLMPTLFLPLIALGLTAMEDFLRKSSSSERLLPGLLMILLSISYFALMPASPWAKNYALLMALLFLGLMYSLWKRDGVYSQRIVPSFIAVIALGDLMGLSHYLRHDTYATCKVQPAQLNFFNEGEPFLIEYQNPTILPLHEYYSVDNVKLCFNRQTHHGLYFHFTPFERYFSPSDIYSPCPTPYKEMSLDAAKIRQSKAQLFTFDGAKTPPQFFECSFSLTQAKVKNVPEGKEVSFTLPQDFPSYLATTLFTPDRENCTVYLEDHLLHSAQGKLILPWTYDVQNVQTGMLTLLLPDKFQALSSMKVHLKVKKIENMTALWKNEHDRLGWTYDAPSDGFLTLRYPFDPKWRLTVDGERTSLSASHTYFMGFPLTVGSHNILLEYWPDTSLRLWIALSILCTVLGFFGTVRYGARYTATAQKE